MKTIKKAAFCFGVAVFWITLWQIAAMIVKNPLILPAPLETLLRLFELSADRDFWLFTALSVLRVFLGILAAIPASLIFAAICSRSKIADGLFAPAVTLMKSTPVVSFILIAIFIIDREVIPSVITFMMVFPVLYENLREGIASAPQKLLEMAKVFRISRFLRIKRIYFPAMKPFFLSALCTSVGLAIKAGIAAEVIAYIPSSIGKKLSDAKSYMEPADLLAWTAVIIILSLLIEKAVRFVINKAQRRHADASNK